MVLRARAVRGGHSPKKRAPAAPGHRPASRKEAAGRASLHILVVRCRDGTLFAVWRRRRDAELPLIIGHRGASAVESENSLAAFTRARADGADGVELDVMTCGTGEIVVFHDDDLVRLGARPEKIAGTAFAVLRGVTLTSGAKIPTLEEVFEACGPDMLVNVELKVPNRGPAVLAPLVDGVAAIVERAGAGGRVLVSSFNPFAVRLWMRRSPAVPAGLLFEHQSPM